MSCIYKVSVSARGCQGVRFGTGASSGEKSTTAMDIDTIIYLNWIA